MTGAVLETRALGKRLRRTWALRDCTLAIPEGAVVGLAGPNGAGKSTLLALAVGLMRPTAGEIAVLGRDPWRDSTTLAEVGYVPQDAPLYRSFTVADALEFARRTNAQWDETVAAAFLAGLHRGTRVGGLTAGDRSRLALAVALGKRPALLLLDEPFARLDPLAGREFLQLLMDGVAEIEATVVIASHVVADIERVCDHIVLMSDGAVRLHGNVDELLAQHRLVTGVRRPFGDKRIRGVEAIVRERVSGRQLTLLARVDGAAADPAWSFEPIGLEDLLLAYMEPEEKVQAPLTQLPPEEERLRWHG
jgi:ABC-2 type transport system ATP-binding protein